MLPYDNTVYVIQYDYKIAADTVEYTKRLNSSDYMTYSGVTYYYIEIMLHRLDTITKSGQTDIFYLATGGTWVKSENYNYTASENNTYVRIAAIAYQSTSVTYTIRYNGINIPNNCTLKFDGGSISDGVVNFNKTYIDAPCRAIFHNVTIPKNESGHALTTQENTYLDWFDQGANGAHYAYLYALQVGSKVVCTPGKEYTFNKNHTLYQSVYHDAEIVGNGAVFRFTSTFADNSDYPDVLYHQRAIYIHDLTVYYHTPAHSFINSQGNPSWSYSRFCSGWKLNPNSSARLENITIYVEPETPTAEFNSAFNTLYETYCGKDFILRNCHLYFSQTTTHIDQGGNTFAWFMFIQCPEEVNVLIEDCSCRIAGRDEALAFSRSTSGLDHDVVLNAIVNSCSFESIAEFPNDAPLVTLGENTSYPTPPTHSFTINAKFDGCTFYRGVGDPECLRSMNNWQILGRINLSVVNSTFTYDGNSNFEYTVQYEGRDLQVYQGLLNLTATQGSDDFISEFTKCSFKSKYVFETVSGLAPVKFNSCIFDIESFVKRANHYDRHVVKGYREFINCQLNLNRDKTADPLIPDGTIYLENPKAKFVNCDITTADQSTFGVYTGGNAPAFVLLNSRLNGLLLPDVDEYCVCGSLYYRYVFTPIVEIKTLDSNNFSFRWYNNLDETATVTIHKKDGTTLSTTIAPGQSTPEGGTTPNWFRCMTVIDGDLVPVTIETATKQITRYIRCGSLENYNSGLSTINGNITTSSIFELNRSTSLSAQVSKPNTIYVIKHDFDLSSNTLTIPAGCTLKFEKGSISNGNIVFNNTVLEDPKFVNCNYSGNIQISAIDDRNFTSQNDTSCLKWLLEQCLLLGTKLDIYRDYTFLMPSSSLAIIPQEVAVSDATIDFHNHTITDTWTATTNGDIRGLISIRGVVNGLTIRNLNLIDQNNNTHLHARSTGMCGLITKGECSDINLDNIYMKYGDGIYRHGGYTVEQNLVINGVVNSKFSRLRVEDCGYSLAIYRGCNLDIDVESIHPHRGIYLGAVDNSRIRYRGYYPQETRCHVLCQESVYYKDNTYNEWDMRGCTNLDITAEILGVNSENDNETVLHFGCYGTGDDHEFDGRQSPTIHSNIRLTPIVNGDTRVDCFVASSSPGNDTERDPNVILKNIELCNADFSKSKNGIGFNLPAGFADIRLKNCVNGDSQPISVHGDATAFSARFTCENTNLGTITALVPVEMVMINSVCTGGSQSGEGMLKIYSYPTRSKSNSSARGNQFVGPTEFRPTGDKEMVGSMFFDDTIHKPLWYVDWWRDNEHPGKWIESDFTAAGTSRIGTFSERPSSITAGNSVPNIQPGFRYHCTDGFGDIIFIRNTGSSGSPAYTDIWKDVNGNDAGVRKLGLITQRPGLNGIVTGFNYIVTQPFTATIETEDPISGESTGTETVQCPAGTYTYISPIQSWTTPIGRIIDDSDFPART